MLEFDDTGIRASGARMPHWGEQRFRKPTWAGRSYAEWRRMQLLQGSRRVGGERFAEGELIAGASEHALKRRGSLKAGSGCTGL